MLKPGAAATRRSGTERADADRRGRSSEVADLHKRKENLPNLRWTHCLLSSRTGLEAAISRSRSSRSRSWEKHYKNYRFERTNALNLEGQNMILPLKFQEICQANFICLSTEYRFCFRFVVTMRQDYSHLEKELYYADELENSPRAWDDIRVEALAIYHVAYYHATKQGIPQYCGFAWKVASSASLIVLDPQRGELLCILSSVLLHLFK